MAQQESEFISKFASFLDKNTKKQTIESQIEALQKIRSKFCAKIMHPVRKEKHLNRLDYLTSHCQRQLNPYRQEEEKNKTNLKNIFLREILKELIVDNEVSDFKEILNSADIEIELALYLYQNKTTCLFEKIPSIAFNPARVSRARLQQLLQGQRKNLKRDCSEQSAITVETKNKLSLKMIEKILIDIQESMAQLLDY